MFGMSLNAAKGNFFDRDKVMKAMSRKTRKVLSRFGAFVRTRAQTSIRKAPKVNVKTGQVSRGRKAKGTQTRDAISRPGNPPFGHAAQLLRKGILFAYEAERESVVIGPAKLDGRSGEALPALEHGGAVSIGPKKVDIEARPFMGPAFAIEREASLPRLWANVPFK